MLHSFSPCNPLVKTKLFDSFCLSLYGSALWFSSSPELRSLEVTFNNILRRIWSLPRTCHTGILHCTAQLNSLYNTVVRRSSKLLSTALKSQSPLVHDVFVQSSTLAYTSLGYNFSRHKIYTDQDILCANFVRDVRLAPDQNSHLSEELMFVQSNISFSYYTYHPNIYLYFNFMLHLWWCVYQINNIIPTSA